ncbi:MAG: DUF3298 and DUF4163 domain-containing protein [Lachnospiraceae bacterium]|nr:DUF3298 and DUF4163 domain-containing protein [Lachnospiraceae bacterium]
MRKKIVIFGLGICLLAAACSGKGAKENNSGNTVKNNSGSTESGEKPQKSEESEKTDEKKKTNTKKEQEAPPKKQEEAPPEEPGEELSNVPEVTFTDYSQNIQDEDSGALLLAVTENCPVISIPENKEAAEKMNMVFEQQHTANETYIQEDAEEARNAYRQLSEEEAANNWSGYGYGCSYKAVYASTRILSIVAENYKWQGNAHPNTWTTSYCFDATTGALLYLSDIFTDKAEAEEIVEKHITDTITKDPYKDALLEDYESYLADVLTENVFYLNDKGLVVICNPDMVTSYAAGTIEVEVPYDALKAVMNPDYIQNQ